MPQDIGNTYYITKIPELADNADIRDALRLYHYGQTTEPATLTSSNGIAFYLSQLQSAVDGKINLSEVSGRGDLLVGDGSASVESEAMLVENPEFEYVLSRDLEYRVISAATGNGTTITYTAANSYTPGTVVSVTGLNVPALNLSNAVVATATPTQFTVTNTALGTATQSGYSVRILGVRWVMSGKDEERISHIMGVY
jgi:hypothetical protein